MAILRFRSISVEDWNSLEVKDENTRYIVVYEDDRIYGEFIGDKKVTALIEHDIGLIDANKQNKLVEGTNIIIEDDVISAVGVGHRPDNVTIVLNEENELSVSKNIEIDGGFL